MCDEMVENDDSINEGVREVPFPPGFESAGGLEIETGLALR